MNKRRAILTVVTLGIILSAAFFVLQWVNGGMQTTIDQGREYWQDWLKSRLSS